MSRFSKGIEQRYNEAYASKTSGKQKIVGLNHRGQNGYLTDMTFMPSTADYIQQPVIVKLLRAPTGFRILQEINKEGNKYIEALVNIIESIMQSWSGFNRTLSVAVEETQIGKSGEVFETPSRVSRARSQLQSTIVERYGMPIMRFLDDYVRILIDDPDVGHPLLSSLSPTFVDKLADMYSFDIIAYEPDPTFKFVNNAWLITNVFPKDEIGEWTANRTLQEAGQKREYQLSWTGVQKVGYAVDQLAQKFMNASRVDGIDPGLQPNYINGMLSDVAEVRTSAMSQIEELKRSMVSMEVPKGTPNSESTSEGPEMGELFPVGEAYI